MPTQPVHKLSDWMSLTNLKTKGPHQLTQPLEFAKMFHWLYSSMPKQLQIVMWG